MRPGSGTPAPSTSPPARPRMWFSARAVRTLERSNPMRVMVMVKAVIKPARKRRLHANAALARNEPGSAYVPNRQLWIREARRHYVPNRALRVRVAGPDGGDAWVPPHEVMNLSLARVAPRPEGGVAAGRGGAGGP